MKLKHSAIIGMALLVIIAVVPGCVNRHQKWFYILDRTSAHTSSEALLHLVGEPGSIVTPADFIDAIPRDDTDTDVGLRMREKWDGPINDYREAVSFGVWRGLMQDPMTDETIKAAVSEHPREWHRVLTERGIEFWLYDPVVAFPNMDLKWNTLYIFGMDKRSGRTVLRVDLSAYPPWRSRTFGRKEKGS